MRIKLFLTYLLLTVMFFQSKAQTTTWYSTAQSRIDTLRKGNFTIRIVDNLGNPVADSIKIIHRKHEFSWGTAYDLSYGSSSGTTNVGSASSAITSVKGDGAAYNTERWGKYLDYDLPAVAGTDYKLTLKLAEVYFTAANSRLFDVYVDGVRVIKNLDKFALAGGKNIAFDTIIAVHAASNKIKVEFNAIKDNVSVNALSLIANDGSSSLYVKAGSGATIGTVVYKADNTYMNNTAAALLATDDDWYKSIMLKYCNYGVCGNQFKWSGIEPSGKNMLNYAPFENTFNWYTSVGWEMRAHNLLWGGNNATDYHCIPQWVMNLSSNPKAMYAECKNRVVREVTRYKGKIKEYDVLNEPTHANYLQKIVGDSINWNCFKWAHEADPEARLYINDYNIIEWQDQTDNFVALVKKMLQNGAPISGIGAQCHIGSSVDLANFKKRFDQLGQFGLPVKVTEFDMGAKSLTEQQYAGEIAKMMRLAFSHPSIQGFIFWGLSEPTWVPESIINLVREDRTIKLAADSLYHLTHEVWTTNLSGQTDVSGNYPFNGYFGDYDVLVKVNGKWERHAVSCKKTEKGKTFDLILGSGQVDKPRLLKVKTMAPNQVLLTFSKKMTNPAAEAKNFKIFDSKLNYITSAALKSEDSTTIILTTGSLIGEKDYLPVSYLKGTLKSADGGVLDPFGATISNSVVPSYVSSRTDKSGKNVSILFDRKLMDASVLASDFKVKVNNMDCEVTQARLSATKDSVIISLGRQITKKTDVVQISYQAGNLLTANQLYVTSFNDRNVTNEIAVAKLISAVTTSSGTIIQLGFDQALAVPSGEELSFKVIANNKVKEVTKVGITSDYKKILVTLSTPIARGETINLSYAPGSLTSKTGIAVTTFSTAVSNYSIVTGLNETDNSQVSIIPNPFNNQLVVRNADQFEYCTIFDNQGRQVIVQKLNNSKNAVINTEFLKKGLYLLKVSNGREIKTFKIVKQ